MHVYTKNFLHFFFISKGRCVTVISLCGLSGLVLVSLSDLNLAELFSLGAFLPFFKLESTGCSNADGGGTGGTGGTDGGNPSTPFLYVWHGEGYTMDNDVMFGRPSSCFDTLQNGKRAYERGDVVPDLYRILTPLKSDQGRYKLLLKEVEPEVSLFDHVSLSKVVVSEGKCLAVSSNFRDLITFNKEEVLCATVVANDRYGNDVSNCLKVTRDDLVGPAGYVKGSGVSLEGGEELTITFQPDSDESLFLILRSVYRDWLLGDIYDQAISSRSAHFFPFKKVLAAATACLIGTATFFGFDLKVDNKLLIKLVGDAEIVHADVPPPPPPPSPNDKSLKIYYWNGSGYVYFDIVQPRYKNTNSFAIALPKEAVIGGQVKLKIVATKLHVVTGLSVAEGQVNSVDTTELSLSKAVLQRTGEDVTNILDTPFDKTYVSTFPSDTIELEFVDNCPEQKSPELREEFLFRIGGVYCRATEAQQAFVPGWTAKLDQQALDFLSDVYKYNTERV